MTRRNLIKGAGVAGVTLIVPESVFPGTVPIDVKNSGFVKFKTGKIELLAVTDGHTKFAPVQPIFAPGAKPDEINKILSDNFLPGDGIDVAYNTLVLRKGEEVVLFDTGCGHHFGPTSGKLADNLQAAGIEPASVTAVLLTHAHPDHIGGLTDKDGKLIYPNATVYISKAEYDFWTGSQPDFSKCKADKGFTDLMISIAKPNLQAAKDNLRFFNDGDLLFDCVKVQVVPGHTPGHTLSHISIEDEELIHMGDISHDATLLLTHPEWGVAFDTDFDAAAKARRLILSDLAEGRKNIFSFHLPWPGLGYIRKKGDGFEWVARPFSTPQIDVA